MVPFHFPFSSVKSCTRRVLAGLEPFLQFMLCPLGAYMCLF